MIAGVAGIKGNGRLLFEDGHLLECLFGIPTPFRSQEVDDGNHAAITSPFAVDNDFVIGKRLVQGLKVVRGTFQKRDDVQIGDVAVIQYGVGWIKAVWARQTLARGKVEEKDLFRVRDRLGERIRCDKGGNEDLVGNWVEKDEA